MIKIIVSIVVILFYSNAFLFAQTPPTFTHSDTLFGSPNENRQWYNVLHYNIDIHPDITNHSIQGINTMVYKRVGKRHSMQIDLQPPMHLDSASINGHLLPITQIAPAAYLINTHQHHGIFYFLSKRPRIETIKLFFHGQPHAAVRAPWDGGWVWKQDSLGNPWCSVACQGDGASLWYPCKDYLGDEPDNGATISVTVPDTLQAIANGRCSHQTLNNGAATYTWEVKSPINNYNIVPYIGKYTHLSDTFQGIKGTLSLDYWVLNYHKALAQKQFEQVKPMLRAFEYWFGAYPFYEDGYKLVEAPYLGMEHQSNIAYGNHFANGYEGRDLSGTGWGMLWDYIIVHESGHEWFGNNISSTDIADEWIHEGFTDYSETLFTEYYYGKAAADAYCYGLRKKILNNKPIIAPYNVHASGSVDRYYKGANLLHTIRHAINNDILFRAILQRLNQHFYHQTVTSSQIENYISEHSHINFQSVFDQYLRYTAIPKLQIYKDTITHTIKARFTNTILNFSLPISLPSVIDALPITTAWQTFTLSAESFDWITPKHLEALYYISVEMEDKMP